MLNLLMAVSNKTMLLILMVVLGVLLVLMTVLGIVFIVALRKRAPVIKVVMAPPAANASGADEEQEEPNAEEPEAKDTAAEQLVMDGLEPAETPKPAEAPKAEIPDEEEADPDDEEDVTYITEGSSRVHYDRSYMSKLIQLRDDSKEWYSQVKNELLSFQKVKGRVSWKRETFRLGRNTLARFVVRGKTLCLLLAVEPEGFAGTKFSVEDVSTTASLTDTPCLYRIKSARRAKYAKEMINAVMKELAVKKDPNFEAQDYFVAYEGTMSLMERGLIKRVVTNSSRTFEVREVSGEEKAAAQQAAANAAEEAAAGIAAAEDAPAENTAEVHSEGGTEAEHVEKA